MPDRDHRPRKFVNILVLLGFVALTLAVGGLAGQVTAANIPTWYAHLAKPVLNPPNWVFAPVWTTLYVLMALAAWRVWRVSGWRSKGVALWLIQLALNFAWSFAFFAAHNPGMAFADLAVLWLAIVATMAVFWRIDRLAGTLLIPYLAWVSFAGWLNFSIWQLNP